MIDQRKTQLQQWLQKKLHGVEVELTPLKGDASFRRYFRFVFDGKSYIAMDAPPDKENIRSFLAVAKTFAQANVRVPKIFASDPEQGFLWLEDFGDRLYFSELSLENAEPLYFRTFDPLIRIQQCTLFDNHTLPHFNHEILRCELNNFSEWFLKRYLAVELEAALLNRTFEFLLAEAESQPQLCAHRDYHSRNLMVLPDQAVGVLDFQDAVWGPVTYDLVSLLRDCYIAWPAETVQKCVKNYHAQALDAKLPVTSSSEEFMRWFDLMGIQRHLKAIFIFARKFLRDGDSSYLKDIPRGLDYVLKVSEHYPELKMFRAALLALPEK